MSRVRASATLMGALPPLPSVVRWAASRGRTEATVLCYHDVAGAAGPGCVEVKEFEAQARYLAAHFHIVAAADILQLVSAGAAGDRRLVAITFDDGLRGAVRNAFPVLRELGLPFTAFVIRARAECGNEPFASLAEISESLGQAGTLGAHGVTHDRPLTELSDEQLAFEMTGSFDLLRSAGVPVGRRAFCYPWAKHDARVENACRSAGFDNAFAGAWRRYHSVKDVFRVGRVTVDGDDDLRVFRAKLAGGRDVQAEWLRVRGPG